MYSLKMTGICKLTMHKALSQTNDAKPNQDKEKKFTHFQLIGKAQIE
jgi:hypothetical protein